MINKIEQKDLKQFFCGDLRIEYNKPKQYNKKNGELRFAVGSHTADETSCVLITVDKNRQRLRQTENIVHGTFQIIFIIVHDYN